MAGNLNKVFLMGNLTRDPELKQTSNGTSVCNFTIATNRMYKGSDGEMKKDTTFLPIIIWGKSGENCHKYLIKGRPVLVEGRIQVRSYDDKEGNKRYVTEIVADNVQFLGNGGDKQSDSDNSFAGAASGEFNASADDDSSVPF